VRFVLRHDRRGTLRFAALQSPFGQRTLERHAQLRGVDSMILARPLRWVVPRRLAVNGSACDLTPLFVY